MPGSVLSRRRFLGASVASLGLVACRRTRMPAAASPGGRGTARIAARSRGDPRADRRQHRRPVLRELHAGSFPTLTTQLYFAGDPFNAVDPFVVRSLIMPVNDRSGLASAHVELVAGAT